MDFGVPSGLPPAPLLLGAIGQWIMFPVMTTTVSTQTELVAVPLDRVFRGSCARDPKANRRRNLHHLVMYKPPIWGKKVSFLWWRHEMFVHWCIFCVYIVYGIHFIKSGVLDISVKLFYLFCYSFVRSLVSAKFRIGCTCLQCVRAAYKNVFGA